MTAVLMKYSMGKGQTSLQCMDLVNLTFLIIIFQMLPNDFVTSKSKGATVKDNAALGMIMTMAKVVLSVYAGVAQQKAMQGDSPGGRVSFIAQVTAQQVCGIPAILLALPLCSQVRGTPLTVFGFFGGQARPFKIQKTPAPFRTSEFSNCRILNARTARSHIAMDDPVYYSDAFR